MRNRPVFWIMKQIRRRIPLIVLMTAAQVGNALFGVLFALGSRGVIDSAVAGDEKLFGFACIRQVGIIAGILVCLTLTRHLRERLSAELERDWKQQLLHGLLHGEYASVSKYHSAELLNRLNADVRKVNDGILTMIPTAASIVTKLSGAVVVLGMLDARFTALLLAMGCIVVIVTGLMRRRLKALNKRVSEHDGRVSGFLQETIEKLLMVQAMDVGSEVERRADALLDERYEIQRRRKNVSLAANTGVSIMFYGAGFMALVWCSARMLSGQMSFGSLTAVIQLVNLLQAPFVNLSGIMPQYVAMLASAERLMELEEIRGEPIPMVADVKTVYRNLQTITAKGLSFTYDAEQVLNDASFELPKGSFAVITGPSGIGKSTLMKLMLGVYKPTEGEMYLCGKEQLRFRIDRTTRRMFAYVPQGNLLLSGTLRDNLTIVKPNASEEDIQHAVYVSAMDDYLPALPHGLDTVLGESGAGLSEGQAQRLAIARAVLSDAPILLLDECTSALDEATEQRVLLRLKALNDRTCIAVTHRPAAIALCDWRLVMNGGKVHTERCNDVV